MKLCPTCGGSFGDAQDRCPTDQTDLIRVRELSAEKEAALIGTVLDNRYTINSRLGAGGMGTVYIATQTAVGRKVAIKVLPQAIAGELAVVRRFMQEAKAASTLSNPNAITIHDFGQTPEGLLYLVMEYVAGDTLGEVLRVSGGLRPERAVNISIQILSALEDAHTRSIVHRDLKPDNVILSPRPGNPDFAKVLDFGLAKIADDAGEGLTRTGQVFGTPSYMSPEQGRGLTCDHGTDIYALGIMLYEMLSGLRPFTADSALAVLVKHFYDAATPFAQLSPPVVVLPELEAIVFRAMAKNRGDRFQSALAMREALEAVLPELKRARGVTSSPSFRVLSPATSETIAPDSSPSVFLGSSASAAPVPVRPRRVSPPVLVAGLSVIAGLAAVVALNMTGSSPHLPPDPTAVAQPDARAQPQPGSQAASPPSKIQPVKFIDPLPAPVVASPPTSAKSPTRASAKVVRPAPSASGQMRLPSSAAPVLAPAVGDDLK